MSTVGQREIRTQERVVTFFKNALGYGYLGYWKDRQDNGNVEEALLTDWLKRQGHNDKIIGRVLHEVGKAAALGGSKTLYDGNREFYGLLRYGVKVKPEIGEQNITVWLIDWASVGNNDFAIAEEVTLAGENTKRPDVVLYVNGIALGVLELKRSIVSVTEGIRQSLDSQTKAFIRPFYVTVQLVMAGNETEGLRYGVIEAPEKYWLRWKEADAHAAAGDNALLRELGQLCAKERLLEIVHDFIVFDAGIKKTCRHNQYFGVRAAQTRVKRREVLGRTHDRKVVRFVHRQPLGRVARSREASPAAKARQRKTLRHVLLVMPRVELIAPFLCNVVPHDDGALAEQRAFERHRVGRRRAVEASSYTFQGRLGFHDHRPVNVGVRFAKNAATPSCKSWLSKISCCATVDIDNPASSGMSCAASTSFFARRLDRGPRAMMVAASWRAPSSAVPSPNQRLLGRNGFTGEQKFLRPRRPDEAG